MLTLTFYTKFCVEATKTLLNGYFGVITIKHKTCKKPHADLKKL